MKHSRAAVHRKVHKLPALRFEQQTLTSYGGLVLLQALLGRLELKDRLRACFSHLQVAPIFGHHLVVLLLVVHLLLGYRGCAMPATTMTTRLRRLSHPAPDADLPRWPSRSPQRRQAAPSRPRRID
jgi:hypothetical protein